MPRGDLLAHPGDPTTDSGRDFAGLFGKNVGRAFFGFQALAANGGLPHSDSRARPRLPQRAFLLELARATGDSEFIILHGSFRRVTTPTTLPTTSASPGAVQLSGKHRDKGCDCITIRLPSLWNHPHRSPFLTSTNYIGRSCSVSQD